MASLSIEEHDISSQAGKVAIVTGGSSGIGLATTKILAEKGATVHVLDINPPTDISIVNVQYHRCDVTKWEDLRSAFERIGHVDYVFPNAGVLEGNEQHFADETDAEGHLLEPNYRVLDVNLKAVYNVVKLAWSQMRKQEKGLPYGIVITISIAAYAPDQGYSVYSGAKIALLGLVRSLRSVMIRDGITINGVAPNATITGMLPAHNAEPLKQMNIPYSEPHSVGRALVYSAIATQDREVQLYGKDKDANLWTRGRWNGRVIMVFGETYTELEEPIADLRPFWLGRENATVVRRQQALSDLRPEQ
ncbi:hypothetical protein E0Z10_g1765 [Xylaria hypoxylon]|uniref:Uncharacterized protein n=1 Tax=Xylaria hypoxylon TaxID=37992 RepID=A0A4Z0Z802_9PEZI|nr:hypothetical protein E0Z10_g1765 [Xylaria hypoxylon]